MDSLGSDFPSNQIILRFINEFAFATKAIEPYTRVQHVITDTIQVRERHNYDCLCFTSFYSGI